MIIQTEYLLKYMSNDVLSAYNLDKLVDIT